MRTVFSPCEGEKVIEKSRFITYSTHIESEEEGREFVAKIRKNHSLATHVCYAFIADKAGNLQRFSDDGEPQGTAGVPILEVLKAKGLTETAVAVVRYFGGVKLGAGGLVRAYSSSAAETLDGADIRTMELCQEYQIEVGYSEADSLQKFIATRACSLLSIRYGESVEASLAVKKSESEGLVGELVDYLQGRVKLQKGREYYAPFEE